MNIAVIADIHGNHLALEACLKYLKGKEIDAYFFLGDLLGEFPGIEQTMEILYRMRDEEKCYFVRGNKEDYQLSDLVAEHQEWDAFPSTVGMFRYAKAHVTEKDRSFFQSLPILMNVKFEGLPEIVICHGSPRKNNEKFTENERLLHEVLEETSADYILCGHTHLKKELLIGNKYVWNPGSLGFSLDEPYTYRFMILHGEDEAWTPEFISLQADAEAIVSEMREAGLYKIAPVWTKMTECLVRNRSHGISHGTVLNRAIEIAKEKYGQCVWPMVPEDCFQEAFETEMLGWKK
ncbi:MAG: metallophosphatase family protein [Acetatifactor sp.]|nr:metallophosphatase family protein [Acetatifactor sp.]